MSGALASYADIYRDGPYAAFPQEHRAGGTLGVAMMEVRQGAVEATDPAAGQITFVASLDGTGPGRGRLRRRLAPARAAPGAGSIPSPPSPSAAFAPRRFTS